VAPEKIKTKAERRMKRKEKGDTKKNLRKIVKEKREINDGERK